jgi:hypothetical protein
MEISSHSLTTVAETKQIWKAAAMAMASSLVTGRMFSDPYGSRRDLAVCRIELAMTELGELAFGEDGAADGAGDRDCHHGGGQQYHEACQMQRE